MLFITRVRERLLELLGLDPKKPHGSNVDDFNATQLGLINAMANKLKPQQPPAPKWHIFETDEYHIHIKPITEASRRGRQKLRAGTPKTIVDADGNEFPNPAWEHVWRTPLKRAMRIDRSRYDGEALRRIRADGRHR